MRREIRGVLTTDGSSDRVLVPIVQWLLRENGCADARIEWLNPALQPEGASLRSRMRAALDYYPCDVVFVHRDAEAGDRAARVEEIRRAVEGLAMPAHVCVVPVRMSEAWLLFDEPALRRAAGNPNGTVALGLPKPGHAEALPDPKTILHHALIAATDLSKRRREKFRVVDAVHRIAMLVDDFTPLRALPAFQALENEVRAVTGRWLAGAPDSL